MEQQKKAIATAQQEALEKEKRKRFDRCAAVFTNEALPLNVTQSDVEGPNKGMETDAEEVDYYHASEIANKYATQHHNIPVSRMEALDINKRHGTENKYMPTFRCGNLESNHVQHQKFSNLTVPGRHGHSQGTLGKTGNMTTNRIPMYQNDDKHLINGQYRFQEQNRPPQFTENLKYPVMHPNSPHHTKPSEVKLTPREPEKNRYGYRIREPREFTQNYSRHFQHIHKPIPPLPTDPMFKCQRPCCIEKYSTNPPQSSFDFQEGNAYNASNIAEGTLPGRSTKQSYYQTDNTYCQQAGYQYTKHPNTQQTYHNTRPCSCGNCTSRVLQEPVTHSKPKPDLIHHDGHHYSHHVSNNNPDYPRSDLYERFRRPDQCNENNDQDVEVFYGTPSEMNSPCSARNKSVSPNWLSKYGSTTSTYRSRASELGPRVPKIDKKCI